MRRAPFASRTAAGVLWLLLPRTACQKGPRNSCPPKDRYFHECVAGREGTTMGNNPWGVTPQYCKKYEPLLGPSSKYAFNEPGCKWMQGDRLTKACQYYCYYDEMFGVARINHALWQAAQRGEAAIWRNTGHRIDRADEAVEGFKQYRKVSVPLGRVLEIGSGPFTQTGTLIDTLKAQGRDPGVAHVDLADPGIESYVRNTRNCAYKGGKLRGYPVTTQAAGGETMRYANHTFDTIVSINVLEHCEDAYEFMMRMHRVLKVGGQLIFHDRVYDDFWQGFDPVRNSNEVAGLHPLRVKRRLVDLLLEHYSVSLHSVERTAAMERRKFHQIPETPLWIVARKNAHSRAQGRALAEANTSGVPLD